MSTDIDERAVELLTELAVGVVTCRLYDGEHPRAQLARAKVAQRVGGLLADSGSGVETTGLHIDVLQQELFFQGKPFTRVGDQMGMLVRHMKRHRIERTTFLKGVSEDEVAQFLDFMAGVESAELPAFQRIQISRVASVAGDGDGIPGGEAALGSVQGRLDAVAGTVAAVASGDPPPAGPAAAVSSFVEGRVSRGGNPFELLSPLEDPSLWPMVHAHNTAIFSLAMAQALDISASQRQDIGVAALFHDIGKWGLPEERVEHELGLQGGLLELDLDHSIIGFERLAAVPQMPELAPIVAFEHHLTMDGRGYPSLPESRPPHPVAALVAVAEATDVLITVRSPRGTVPGPSAAGYLNQEAGTQFDPFFVQALQLIWKVSSRSA